MVLDLSDDEAAALARFGGPRRPMMKPYRGHFYRGPPMTLGNAAAAGVRLVVWCRDCRRQVEPDPAEMAERYGADMTVPDWHARLTCSGCGSRQVDFVVTGTER
jgi:hypothetical protein